MTLGEHLKKLRTEANFSQPELAEKVGIEQSYLSKLENDKSIPSNETFRSLLKAFRIEISEFLSQINDPIEQVRLQQIPDVELWFNKQKQGMVNNQRRYLYICSALIVLAVTLFYMGFSQKVISDIRYDYISEGVVLKGEPNTVFNDWSELINDDDLEKKILLLRNKEVEMAKRKDLKTFMSYENRGNFFVEDVDGGKRLYDFDRKYIVPQSINSWLEVIGVLLFSMGIMGFVLERRFFKI